MGHGSKEDEDSLTDLGSELDKNGNEVQNGAKRSRTTTVKTEPEPEPVQTGPMCVNCKILREEKRNADNEIIRREKELVLKLRKRIKFSF